MSVALDQLGDKADKVVPIFITVDPERDTPQAMSDFVKNFGPRLVGLSGSPEAVAAAAKAWAKAGFGIIGVHLDLRGTIENANAVRAEIAATGVPVVFHNVNAADDEKRAGVVAATKESLEALARKAATVATAMSTSSASGGSASSPPRA